MNVESRRTRGYGFKPGLPGVLTEPADLGGLQLKHEVDPRRQLPPVFDQGGLGSCTANATTAAFQYDAILDGKDPGPLSRLWVYYGERKLEGVLGQGDTGAYGHDAFKVASTVGVPAERDWPYDISTFEGPPPPAAVSDAGHYRLTRPVRAVPQIETSLKQVLSNRQTVAFGFTVYESFESDDVASTGLIPLPKRGEKVLGGHEVLLVGYLAAHPEYALVRNSWGGEWGLGGYFLMPWAYITSRSLSSDHRTIVRPLGH
jgi:C1A family cysteine protease